MKKDRDQAKSRRKKATEEVSPLHMLFTNSAKAAAVAFLAAFIFILVGCFISYSLRDPTSSAKPIAAAALFVSFFICGFTAARLGRGNPLVSGLFSAAVYLAPIFIVSLILRSSGVSASGNGAVMALITLPCSVIGAFFGNIRLSGRRTARSRRRR